MTSAYAPSTWLPRLLFWLVTTGAFLLLAFVVVAPWLDGETRLVGLFARDATVRRTAVASAVGLLVTACIFFRPPRARAGANRPPSAPPPAVVGA